MNAMRESNFSSLGTKKSENARCEILQAVLLKIQVFGDVMLVLLESSARRFERN